MMPFLRATGISFDIIWPYLLVLWNITLRSIIIMNMWILCALGEIKTELAKDAYRHPAPL